MNNEEEVEEFKYGTIDDLFVQSITGLKIRVLKNIVRVRL